jgi:hypothetical protein
MRKKIMYIYIYVSIGAYTVYSRNINIYINTHVAKYSYI